MTLDASFDDAGAHDDASLLLPWYVNDTLGDRDRLRVEVHLRHCATCRDDLQFERALYERMSADSGLGHVPAASLKRLNMRLDEAAGRPAEQAAGQVTPETPAAAALPARRPRVRWQSAMAASVAIAALAAGALAIDRWTQRLAPVYRTVTTPQVRSDNEVIRAVFSPTITLKELQAILDEAQLRIVSGPTEAGVYSLTARSGRPASSSLALLRAHPTVRFAESLQQSAAGASR